MSVNEELDLDRCGWGTDWGCKEQTEYPVILVINGRAPMGPKDDGKVLFHKACFPDELAARAKPAFPR